ncbi:MAG: DUF192 domain-containing protein [Parcubacteria group bacterium]|jgi:hypothetical protein
MKQKNKQLRKILASIGIVIGISCIVYFFVQKEKGHEPRIKIGNQKVTLDVAVTEQEKMQGLSGRTALCDACGMLFVFDSAMPQTFWMKDMLFDIDVLWIDQNTIVGLQKDISHKRQEKEVFVSSKPADKVVELPAGFIDTHHVWVGQIVDFSDIYSSNDGF